MAPACSTPPHTHTITRLLLDSCRDIIVSLSLSHSPRPSSIFCVSSHHSRRIASFASVLLSIDRISKTFIPSMTTIRTAQETFLRTKSYTRNHYWYKSSLLLLLHPRANFFIASTRLLARTHHLNRCHISRSHRRRRRSFLLPLWPFTLHICQVGSISAVSMQNSSLTCRITSSLAHRKTIRSIDSSGPTLR